MISTNAVQQIIFACDAGMGSSAMGASILREKVKKAGLDIPVTNKAISNLTDTPNTLIVTQEEWQNVRLRKHQARFTSALTISLQHQNTMRL